MRRFTPVLGVCVALTLPASLAAQQDEGPPPTLRISFFQCDFSKLGEAMEEVEQHDIPIWNELVEEGMVESYGYFIHSWADEWNVGIYTIAESIQAVIDANDEAGRRADERFPDAPNVFGEACPTHRDNFYVLGPQTGNGREAAGGS